MRRSFLSLSLLSLSFVSFVSFMSLSFYGATDQLPISVLFSPCGCAHQRFSNCYSSPTPGRVRSLIL